MEQGIIESRFYLRESATVTPNRSNQEIYRADWVQDFRCRSGGFIIEAIEQL